MKTKYESLFAIALIGALVTAFAVYYAGLSGPFLLDDSANIDQTQIRDPSWEEWVRATFSNDSGRLGRPIAAFSFATTTFFHTLDPWAFKYENLMLHLLCGVLLFLLGSKLLQSITPLGSKPARVWTIAGIAATIWLLHPLNVSTTLYPVQRMTQLSAIFVILALIAYTTLRPKLTQRPWMTVIAISALIGISSLLSLFSKENGALLPVYLLILETVIFRWKIHPTSQKITRAPRYALITFHTLFVFLPLTVGLVYVATHWEGFINGYANREFSMQGRLLTESRIVWFYLRLIFVPSLSDMTLFHDGYPVQHSWDILTGLAIGAHICLITFALWFRRHAPILAFGILFFYACHLLESTFISLELVFEHRNYLAAWAPLLAFTYYLTYNSDKLRDTRIARGVAIAGFIGICAFMTHTRALTWSNGELLYKTTLRTHPNSVRALTNLANTYFNRGQVEAARPLLERAIHLSPNEAAPVIHLMATYCRSDSWPPELYADAKNRLRTKPISVYTRNAIDSIVKLKTNEKCPAASPKQLTSLTVAFLNNPRNIAETRFYSLIHHGRALLNAERTQDAIATFKEADNLRTKASYNHQTYALEGLIRAYLEEQKPDKAKQTIASVLQMSKDPRIAPSESIKGILNAFQGIDLSKFRLEVSDTNN